MRDSENMDDIDQLLDSMVEVRDPRETLRGLDSLANHPSSKDTPEGKLAAQRASEFRKKHGISSPSSSSSRRAYTPPRPSSPPPPPRSKPKFEPPHFQDIFFNNPEGWYKDEHECRRADRSVRFHHQGTEVKLHEFSSNRSSSWYSVSIPGRVSNRDYPHKKWNVNASVDSKDPWHGRTSFEDGPVAGSAIPAVDVKTGEVHHFPDIPDHLRERNWNARTNTNGRDSYVFFNEPHELFNHMIKHSLHSDGTNESRQSIGRHWLHREFPRMHRILNAIGFAPDMSADNSSVGKETTYIPKGTTPIGTEGHQFLISRDEGWMPNWEHWFDGECIHSDVGDDGMTRPEYEGLQPHEQLTQYLRSMKKMKINPTAKALESIIEGKDELVLSTARRFGFQTDVPYSDRHGTFMSHRQKRYNLEVHPNGDWKSYHRDQPTRAVYGSGPTELSRHLSLPTNENLTELHYDAMMRDLGSSELQCPGAPKCKGQLFYEPETKSATCDQCGEMYFRPEHLNKVKPKKNESNDSIPDGTDQSNPNGPDYPGAALSLQALHRRLGSALPELHALTTSTRTDERAALSMLFNEMHTAHCDIGNVMSYASQIPDLQMSQLYHHYESVISQMMAALDPYRVPNPAVARGPYHIGGTLNDSVSESKDVKTGHVMLEDEIVENDFIQQMWNHHPILTGAAAAATGFAVSSIGSHLGGRVANALAKESKFTSGTRRGEKARTPEEHLKAADHHSALADHIRASTDTTRDAKANANARLHDRASDAHTLASKGNPSNGETRTVNSQSARIASIRANGSDSVNKTVTELHHDPLMAGLDNDQPKKATHVMCGGGSPVGDKFGRGRNGASCGWSGSKAGRTSKTCPNCKVGTLIDIDHTGRPVSESGDDIDQMLDRHAVGENVIWGGVAKDKENRADPPAPAPDKKEIPFSPLSSRNKTQPFNSHHNSGFGVGVTPKLRNSE